MKKIYLFLLFIAIFLISCNGDDPIQPIDEPDITYVNFNINDVPYSKLSTYSFFIGDLKNLNPAYKVIPYEPASSLFTDYTHKKRFIWMPSGKVASYESDGKTLNFPVGTVLIKNFYYNTIQPNNTTKIIETRLMIRKESGWIFAEYLWNDAQTEATLVSGTDFSSGSSQAITFKKPDQSIVTTDYRIPSESECFACHKFNNSPVPIGTKPQNMNFSYNYPEGMKNQLQKLVNEGYLTSYPSNIVSTVNYADTSKSLELRARSYLDINCAHCHQDLARCDYRAIRLSFSQTANPDNLGICVSADEPINSNIEKIIFSGDYTKSVLNYRLSTNEENFKMPLFGRSIVHDEGVLLIQQWINTLGPPCN